LSQALTPATIETIEKQGLQGQTFFAKALPVQPFLKEFYRENPFKNMNFGPPLLPAKNQRPTSSWM
jgi:hypothetical protein